MKIKIFSNSRVDMPLKSYKKSRKVSRRRYSKKPRGYSKKSLVKLIRNVSLKKVETKHTHNIYENLQLYHNTPAYAAGCLATSQSVADDDTGVQNVALRIGDEVVARGMAFKFWFANKLDRPNITYKIVIFKYQSGYTLGTPDPFYAAGTTNFLIRDLNTEQFKILKVINFKIQTSAQRITSTDTFAGAEGHKAISVYLPMKNMKIKYHNGSSIPKYTNIGYTVVAYDSYGTLTTDNIASYAVNFKFYFKDP